MMKLRLLPFVLFGCLQLFLGVAAAEEQPDKTILPQIVVQGEDRSFLQITREKQEFFMEYLFQKEIVPVPEGTVQALMPPHGLYPVQIVPTYPVTAPIVVERTAVESPHPQALIPWSFTHDLLGMYSAGLHPMRGTLTQTASPLAPQQPKEFIHPPLQVSLDTKPTYIPIEAPAWTGETIRVVSAPPRESIPPLPVEQFGLTRTYASEARLFAHTPEAGKPEVTIEREQWGLIEGYPRTRGLLAEDTSIQYQTGLSRTAGSEEPFLIASLELNDRGGLDYGIDFGKEGEETRYLLGLERESQPQYATFEGTEAPLGRSHDLVSGTVKWGQASNEGASLSAFAQQVDLDLPNAYTRKDTMFGFRGQIDLSSQWNIEAWLEKSTRDDVNVGEEKYDDLRYGLSVKAEPQGVPMFIEAGLERDNLRRLAPTQASINNTQTLLQIGWPDPVIIGENLVLDQPRLGIRGTSGQARITGSGKIRWYLPGQWQAILSFDRSYYLPSFYETYIVQDYSKVELDLEPVDMTTLRLGAVYAQLNGISFASELLIQSGEDIVWIYDELPQPRMRPETIPLRRVGLDLHAEWQAAPGMTIRPSISLRNLENTGNPDEKVPHEPDTEVGLQLVVVLSQTDLYTLSLEGKSTWLGNYYYTFDPADVGASAANFQLKLTYRQEDWEIFTELKNHDSLRAYNYKPPSTALTVGAAAHLF